MWQQISRQVYRFCAIKDKIYEFDRSAISLSVRIKSLTDFEDFEKLKNLNIRRVVYDLNTQTELNEFLTLHNDDKLKVLLDQNQFIFRGINLTVNSIIKDQKIRKLDHRALLQISQHIFKLKGPENKSQFSIFLGLHHELEQKEEELLGQLKEEFDELQSTVENSFSFEVNHLLQWNKFISYELLFKIANQQNTPKSVDLNVFKYADQSLSELDQNRQILATLYQNATERYNTMFVRNFNGDEEVQDITEGIVSFQHVKINYIKFIDMLKLMHYRGTIVIDYNKYLEKNTQFIDQLLINSKYSIVNKPSLDDHHEQHLVDQDETLIQV